MRRIFFLGITRLLSKSQLKLATNLALTILVLMASTLAQAKVYEVNIWKPFVGKNQTMYEHANAARQIHEKHGATVRITNDFVGRMHYTIEFENWKTWNAFYGNVLPSKDWVDWQAKASKDPAAELMENWLVNVAAEGKTGPVYQTFIWKAMPGRINELVQAGITAKAIHEKAGTVVNVGVDQLNRMHYAMSFPSWDAYAEFQDTPNPEFGAFMAEQNKDPTGELVEVHNGGVQE